MIVPRLTASSNWPPRPRTLTVGPTNLPALCHTSEELATSVSAHPQGLRNCAGPQGLGRLLEHLQDAIGALLGSEAFGSVDDHHASRASRLYVVGGGIVQDLGAFAAYLYKRGIPWVFVPTTLLAQVDSSVGGKTAINASKGKNLIGAFYQPILVIADTALLDTLPEREFRAGYAEVVKYGLLGDREFFEWLDANWRDVFAGGPAREHAIAVSCRAKAAIVARDERETGDRMLLNLGHTFGHAFEAAAGYSDQLLHGEAVGLGMSLAFEFSARRGLIAKAEVDRVIADRKSTRLNSSHRT